MSKIEHDEYAGFTLRELASEIGFCPNGICVRVLQDEKDEFGKILDEQVSLRLILKKHPEYADAVVKSSNQFYSLFVLRVTKPV